MKRSEALKLMYDTALNIHNGMGNLASPEYLIDSMLNALEKAGMLPPIEPGRTEYDLDLGVPEWEEE